MSSNLANPAPLGLCGFALTTFVLSCYNAGIFGVSSTAPVNLVTGLALFYGGLAQGLAGMWEFLTGNTFTATAFTSYGAFWISYATLLIPWFGIDTAYAESHYANEQSKALAIFLLGWTIFTMIMLIASLRTSVALIILFASVLLTFSLLTIAEFGNHPKVHRAGGFTGLIASFLAWYNAMADLLAKENATLTLPVGKIKARV